MTTSDCCISKQVVDNPPFKNMLLSDWYDGPTAGVIICEHCAAEYYFFLVDWSRDHVKRVFALQRMLPDTIPRITKLVGEAPSWPLWFPTKFKHPSDSEQRVLADWWNLIDTAAPPSVVVLWDIKSSTAVRCRCITEETPYRTVYLLDQEVTESGFDWLAYLGSAR